MKGHGGFVLIIFIFCAPLGAQQKNENLLKGDVDSLFEDSKSPADDEDLPPNPVNSFISTVLKSSGFALQADYNINAFFFPGWKSRPWDEGFNKKDIISDKQLFGAEMAAAIGVDIQISSFLHFWQSVQFVVPGMEIKMKEFYGEYNLKNIVFLKMGKFDYNWGLNKNFPYTNLLTRIPGDSDPGDLYLAKVDIPIGIGGIQVLSFTRSGFIENWSAPKVGEFAAGAKFNLIFAPYADIDIGSVYYKEMPFRTFVSVKSTVFKSSEIYMEGLVAADEETWDDFGWACSAGIYQDFLNGKIRLNAELYYNGEFKDASFYYKDTNRLEETKIVYPFIPGLNAALNIFYKPGGLAGLNAGIQFLYAFNDNSGEIIPGVSVTPARHLKIYLALPLVLGGRNGVYYTHNALDKLNNHPFSFILIASIGGNYRFNYYKSE